MLRFSYETSTNSWFYGEWIVKIIAKVMILIIHFVLHKKRRETMKDDKKEKSEQRYMERIRLIKDRVVNTRPEMDLENAKIMTESFKETRCISGSRDGGTRRICMTTWDSADNAERKR